MKKIFFLMVMFISAVFAQSELKYEMVKTHKVFTDPASPNDTLLVFILEYPDFDDSGDNKKLGKFLNQQVMKIYTDTSFGSSDFTKVVEELKSFREDSEGSPFAAGWYIEKKVSYDSPVSGIGSLTFSGYQYLGGAHGGSWVYYNNYDLKKQKKLKLTDVMVKNYQKTLLGIGEKIFRGLKGLTPDQSLEGEFWFDNNKFHFNNNFLFTKEGLVFYYNEYEISCYACGTTELLIPWKDIKTLVKKDGPLGHLTK
ncbi:MAG: hypothetical protein HBSAPP04_07840 [Ignavibacteriaceae bacterium]|nr:MAG: hypothetical protein HBSAPP04_07840 [Ignavibacteriaceae bacterium]